MDLVFLPKNTDEFKLNCKSGELKPEASLPSEYINTISYIELRHSRRSNEALPLYRLVMLTVNFSQKFGKFMYNERSTGLKRQQAPKPKNVKFDDDEY